MTNFNDLATRTTVNYFPTMRNTESGIRKPIMAPQMNRATTARPSPVLQGAALTKEIMYSYAVGNINSFDRLWDTVMNLALKISKYFKKAQTTGKKHELCCTLACEKA